VLYSSRWDARAHLFGAHIAQERTVKITGFGAKSGVVRVFGINSEAAMKAAAEAINNSAALRSATAARAS